MDSKKDNVKRWPLDGERTAWEEETCGTCDEFAERTLNLGPAKWGCWQQEGCKGRFTEGTMLTAACFSWRPRVTLASYQQDIQRTAREELSEKDRRIEAAIGAASEAGEIAGLIKKHYYQGHDLDTRKIIEESGDTLYYLARGLQEIGSSLEVAMQVNVLKRLELYPKGFDPARSRDRGR